MRLDEVQGAVGGGEDAPRFQGASADGTRAFFTDTRELSPDAGAGRGRPDLYACDLVREGGEGRCELSDLTPETSEREAADVQGVVTAIDEAGENVYFVANGALAPGASRGGCTVPVSAGATCNLYLAHRDGAGWSRRFIATLSNLDAADWGLVLGGGAEKTKGSSSPRPRRTAATWPSCRAAR